MSWHHIIWLMSESAAWLVIAAAAFLLLGVVEYVLMTRGSQLIVWIADRITGPGDRDA